MKVLLIFPTLYSLNKSLTTGFQKKRFEVTTFDYRAQLNSFYEKVNSNKAKLTHSLRSRWNNYYFQRLNKLHLDYYHQVKPDLVFVYNNEMLLPSTLKEFKKNSRVFFFLGDSPFYTPTSEHNLALLFEADQVFSPDTGWIEQLKMLGLKNINHLIYYTEDGPNYQKSITPEEKQKYGSDLVFVGNNYPGSWGFKRGHFLNQFAGLGLKLYGPASWYKYFDNFPELKNCFIPHQNGRLSFEEMNTILNCARLYPVDANPGIVNGIHLRVFECIASGILPLMEYRKDMDLVFSDLEIPVVKDYSLAAKIAEKYLMDEDLTKKTLINMRKHLLENFSINNAIEQICSHL